MNTFINSILSLYKNKSAEPRNGFSPERYARQWVNSLLIVIVVVFFIAALIIVISIYEAVSGLFSAL
jgi:hypothetical protein